MRRWRGWSEADLKRTRRVLWEGDQPTPDQLLSICIVLSTWKCTKIGCIDVKCSGGGMLGNLTQQIAERNRVQKGKVWGIYGPFS